MRWGNRRREIKEIEKRNKEIDEKIEIRKKKKEERRKRAIRERRCFVCEIFGHMARYCRNREKKKGLAQVPKNKFEVLRDRVMQRGEGSGKEEVKDRKESLKEEKGKEGEKDEERKERKERKDERSREERGKDRERERSRNVRFLQRRNLEGEIPPSMVKGAVL